MTTKKILVLALSFTLLGCKSTDSMQTVLNKGIQRATQQSELLAATMANEKDSLPRTFNADGRLVKSNSP